MRHVLAIAQIEIKDLLRSKAMYTILALSIFVILALRGCSTGNDTGTHTVLNQEMRQNISIQTAYHIITFFSLGLCGLIASGILPRELEDKTLVMVISRPVSRLKYLTGKCVSVVFVSSGILLFLGTVLCAIRFFDTGYSNKSIICGYLILQLNIIFITVSSFFFSLFVPRVIVPLISFLIYATSILLDLPFHFNKLTVLWRPPESFKAIHSFFPQLGSIQLLSGSWMTAPLHLNDCVIPAANVLFYSVLFSIGVVVLFNKKQL